MDRLACDVLVIGAGPAGSTSARYAAEAGADVILIERRREVGLPVQCAGYVSAAIRWHIDLPEGCIAQRVDRLGTHLPDGSLHEVEAPGYMLHRAALDRRLASEATRVGGRLLLGTAATGFDEGGVLVRHGADHMLIEPRVIIGADGPTSLVGRRMGLCPPDLAHAMQYELALASPVSAAQVFFRRDLPGGYAWLFPAGDLARVGAASISSAQETRAILDAFVACLRRQRMVDGSPVGFTASLVPVSGVRALVFGNMLLVGDAAGQTHPVTGAGILNAIIAGEMAGRAAARAALGGDVGLLREYEEEWRELMGPSQARALTRRGEAEAARNYGPDELSEAIRRRWIAFDAYYRD